MQLHEQSLTQLAATIVGQHGGSGGPYLLLLGFQRVAPQHGNTNSDLNNEGSLRPTILT